MNRKEQTYHDDETLLKLYFNEKNNEYLGILLQRYSLLVFGVCKKYLKDQDSAKDAVQQIFMKVLTEAGKFNIGHFKSWLYMVARNHCLMQLRKKGKNISDDELMNRLPADDSSEIEKLFEQEKELNRLEEAVLKLNTEQQNCIRLFYLEKKSYKEIAAITGYSETSIKSYIQNGKRNLRILLEKKKPGDER